MVFFAPHWSFFTSAFYQRKAFYEKVSNTFFTSASSVRSVVACFSLKPKGKSSSLYFCSRSSTDLRSHCVKGAKCADFEIPFPMFVSSILCFCFFFCLTEEKKKTVIKNRCWLASGSKRNLKIEFDSLKI